MTELRGAEDSRWHAGGSLRGWLMVNLVHDNKIDVVDVR